MFRKVVARLAVAVFTGALLTACDAPPELSCDWMKLSGKPDPEGAVVVLVDASNSTRSDEADKAPDYAAALRDRLQQAVEHKRLVSIGSFSGSAAAVKWSERGLRTDDGANSQNRQLAVQNATKCLQQAVSQAAAEKPLERGTDVLGAATAAFEELRTRTGSLEVVLATDGLATVGCASLEKAAIGRMDALENVVSLCKTRIGELGKAPDGTKLSLVGVGHPAIGAPKPSTGQLMWLGELWRRLCETTGVKMVDCEVSTGSVTGSSPRRAPHADLADPVVAFPKPEDGVDGEKEIVWALGDSDLVLFEFDTHHLKPQGIAQIERIAEKIKQYPRATTTITGHTDHRGTNAYNMGLSERRAEAVRTVLRNNGVTAVETRWFGEEKPLCPGEDEPAMQCNRRVEIVTNKGW